MEPVILVTGKNGQLGMELHTLAQAYPQWKFIFTDRTQLDIGNLSDVDQFFESHKISACINAAAYTAVDKAETEQQQALLINAKAVENLALNCKKHQVAFVHVSTDYVFDGTGNTPYKEDDTPNPVNFYGQSKLVGEKAALQILPSAVIIRTSWVYSRFGNNFVKTMLRLMNDRPELNVVGDQYGSPTYAADLADDILCIVEKLLGSPIKPGGIYHYSNEGIITWFDFAVEIKRLGNRQTKVNAIPTSGFPTPAKRPAYSVMDKHKITQTFGIQLKDWKESLQTCMHLL